MNVYNYTNLYYFLYVLRRNQKNVCLVYLQVSVPSYSDYVGIRNILLKNDQISHDFIGIIEYARIYSLVYLNLLNFIP